MSEYMTEEEQTFVNAFSKMYKFGEDPNKFYRTCKICGFLVEYMSEEKMLRAKKRNAKCGECRFGKVTK